MSMESTNSSRNGRTDGNPLEEFFKPTVVSEVDDRAKRLEREQQEYNKAARIRVNGESTGSKS